MLGRFSGRHGGTKAEEADENDGRLHGNGFRILENVVCLETESLKGYVAVEMFVNAVGEGKRVLCVDVRFLRDVFRSYIVMLWGILESSTVRY